MSILPRLRGWPLSQSALSRFPILRSVPVDRPVIMGIVNTTPDSFSDGGRYVAVEAAVAHARALHGAGAHIVDVGGESTRPGAETVPVEEEIKRTVPVVMALAEEGIPASIDTRNAATMQAALAAGAAIINDVTALTHDSESIGVVAEAQCPTVLMHIQGTPQTMQAEPCYENVVEEVAEFLQQRAQRLMATGMPACDIALDPGIGFGKTLDHNMQLLASTHILAESGHPLLLGVSRKSFVAKASLGEAADNRLPGSLAAMLHGIAHGAGIVRVHDVRESVQAVAILEAIHDAGRADWLRS